MILIVGLGNPGEKYQNTRHNLGFLAIDRLLRKYESAHGASWKDDEKLKSSIIRIDWQPKQAAMKQVILAKPLTYMNNSGMAVSLLVAYYKVDPSDIWIIHDELDLPIGSMRIRFGGAAAGHRGVESVLESLGTDKFWRFRLGIGLSHPHIGRESREDAKVHAISRQNLGSVDKYVLSAFGSEDHGKVRELIKHAADAMEYALERDLDAAMNCYNTK